ncbi:MAG: ParA family protein [Dehalococcoidia bacterium]
MKGIATINFKGGVGKTTITWLLAKYAAEHEGKKVLVIDTDAQMSLTLAVQLQESGMFDADFDKWYEQSHKAKNKTILDALDKYDNQTRGHFDFPIDTSFIYKISDNLHFVPSVVDLYWLEMDVFQPQTVKDFIRALLGKIERSKGYEYDYVFFDCPPNFTALSYSVLSCSSMILIPINPDVFASRGVALMIEGLQYRIQPWPNPKIRVFMNKAKLYQGHLTRESQRYLLESRNVCNQKKNQGVDVEAFDSYIPDRVDVKRAIPGRYFPNEYVANFRDLWNEIQGAF